MRSRRISLPKRHDIHTVLELPAEDAGVRNRENLLAQLNPRRKKPERIAVAQAIATIDKRSILPTLVLASRGYLCCGIMAACNGAVQGFGGGQPCARHCGASHQEKQEQPCCSSHNSSLPSITKLMISIKRPPQPGGLLLSRLELVSLPPVPSARRPCRSSNRHSAYRRSLPELRASESSGSPPCLPAWCKWWQPSSLRSSPSEYPQP